MILTVLVKNVNLCLYPAVNVKYAAGQFVSVINDSCVIFSHVPEARDEM